MFDRRMYTFHTLYREMNYRKTAEVLNMTQPGVTQHIQFLEAEYGVKLFQYEGKILSRTTDAELLEQYIQRVLAEERELKRKFQHSNDYLLRIGATKTIGEFVIHSMAEHFMRVPSNRLELMIDNTEALLASVDTGNLDFALIEGRQIQIWISIVSERTVCRYLCSIPSLCGEESSVGRNICRNCNCTGKRFGHAGDHGAGYFAVWICTGILSSHYDH